jgi:hypothetical protein
MTWRQLFNWRPKWWIALAARLRSMTDSDAESDAAEPRHHSRSSAERARFWAEFRAGQHEADLRVLEDRKVLVPCPENGDPK